MDNKRVWLITGASRGIGAKIAAVALARGDSVIGTGRNPQQVTDALGENANLLAVKLDVTDESQVASAVEASIQKFGRIDILVNNAGYGLLGSVEEASAEEVRKVYDANVFGLLHVTRAVLPHMRKQRSGHVINMSSVGGYRSGAGFGVYCSTKFAVEGLTEALHQELAPLGIHVTVVEPGYFRTEFLEGNSLVTEANIIEDYAATSGQVRAKAKEISLNQPGDPNKLATAMLTLVDSKNPPLRLPLGTDAVEAIEAKNEFVAGELKQWRELSVSTNFTV